MPRPRFISQSPERHEHFLKIRARDFWAACAVALLASSVLQAQPVSPPQTVQSSTRLHTKTVRDVRSLPSFPSPNATNAKPTKSETHAGATNAEKSVLSDDAPSSVALDDALVSNATPADLDAVRGQLAVTTRLLAARDPNALQMFGLPSDNSFLRRATQTPKSKISGDVTTQIAAQKTASGASGENARIATDSDVKFSLSRIAVTANGALLRVKLSNFDTVSDGTTSVVAPRSSSSKKTSSQKTLLPKALPQPFVRSALLTHARTYDVWMARQSDGAFLLTDSVWPIARDAVDAMSDEAERHWQNSAFAIEDDDDSRADKTAILTTNVVSNAAQSATQNPSPVSANLIERTQEGDILDLVAERRGGQWRLLRASAPWRGQLLDPTVLARAERKQAQNQIAFAKAEQAKIERAKAEQLAAQTDALTAISSTRSAPIEQKTPVSSRKKVMRGVRLWLLSQMKRYENQTAGSAHFLLQRGQNGWVGVDSVFEPTRESASGIYNSDETQSRRLRAQMAGDGFLEAQKRRDFALNLARLGLSFEAADELAKTRLLEPTLVSDKQTQTFERNRVLDARVQARAQRDALARIGFAPEHPILRVPYLISQMKLWPSPLTSLRLGSEYSRLGYEREAAQSLGYGEANAATFLALPSTSEIDRAWFKVLRDQLTTRLAQAASKPSNLIRSDLFTVRCSLNDANAPQLLAGLENAQYRIYSSFGVPMGNTEVILWSSQNQFQAYTSRQAGRNTSEFVTALTITQLVNADVGPVVLGEEINFFADARADSISTIAHEYGHIAVRALARGRLVPDWLNEGIATYTEGGYENYLARVRNAKKAGNLLSMAELSAWDVDGNRAFLAYSQANSMIDFIVARWGNDAVLEILRQIGKDIAPETALRQTLRVSPDAFYALWRQNGIK